MSLALTKGGLGGCKDCHKQKQTLSGGQFMNLVLLKFAF